ncbi:hypothetical protein [Oceanobacillus rekensis]|uniref:hypothetical protein n=1 Tax=Oceanobacillus rekensis TaxID=937927 RepID=UPI000B4318CA|nr:hypothetical protein [Oceanobacillus rekensis]
MKNSTMNLILGSALTASGAVLAMTAYKQRQSESGMSNSQKVDKIESVDADKDPAERGLTQLDHAHRAEWMANGFPQTHREMEELEEQEKRNQH